MNEADKWAELVEECMRHLEQAGQAANRLSSLAWTMGWDRARFKGLSPLLREAWDAQGRLESARNALIDRAEKLANE